MDNVIDRSLVVTGYGFTVTHWWTRITAHAVDGVQASERIAVCGAPLFDLDRGRPWVVQDASDYDACKLCLEARAI